MIVLISLLGVVLALGIMPRPLARVARIGRALFFLLRSINPRAFR